MSDGDLLARCADHDLPHHVDNLVAHLQGKGLGGNVTRDLPVQLSAPEAAAWTGAKYRLTFCRSGLEVWMELQQFLPQGRVPVGQPIRDRGDFTSTVARLVQMDGGT